MLDHRLCFNVCGRPHIVEVSVTEDRRLVNDGSGIHGVSSAVQEAIWLRRLLSKFGKIDLQRPTAMKCDNQSAICFMKDPTEEMLADALTKSLTKDKMKLPVKFLDHERKETK